MRNFDTMRTTASHNSHLAGAVANALGLGGDISVRALRTAGFRTMEAVEDAVRNQFRTNATPLPERSQVLLDQAVVEVGLQRLTFVADLLAEGLTYNLPDPLSVTQVEWNAQNKVGAAQRTMTPSARGENKIPLISPNRIPVYLTTDNFEIDIRTLRQSQRVGMPLDTATIKQCTRAVNEGLEDAAINGATTLDGQALQVAGYTAPGLLNAPNANTGNLSLASWVTTPAGATIMAQVLTMISALQADYKFGPYNLYVPTAVYTGFQNDFKINGDASILARLQGIDAGGRALRIRSVDMMPATKVALIQMTSDVVDIVDGQRPTVIPWTSLDGFTIYNLVMAIMIPRFRSDYNGNSGVYVGTLV